MTSAAIFAIALVAVGPAFMITLLRPRLLWPVVFTGCVVTSGLVLDQVSFLDEMVAGASLVALGFAMATGLWTLSGRNGHITRPQPSAGRVDARDGANAIRKRPLFAVDRWPASDRAHLWLFLVTCAYMGFQSLRGILITDSPRKIRWMLFFALVALLATALLSARRALPQRRHLATLLCGAGLAYFAIYLAVGMFSEAIVGESRYSIQNLYWGGTAYAAFPLVAVVPAAALLLTDSRAASRGLAWLTLGTIILQAFYYDSRVSWQALLVFLIAMAPAIGARRALIIGGGFTAMLWLFLTFFWPSYYDLAVFGQILVGPIQGVVQPDSMDFSNFSRYAHTQIGLEILSSHPEILLAGTGFRASDALVGPALAGYYWAHGFDAFSSTVEAQVSTIGVTALLIETGVIGFGLYLSNFLMAGFAIIRYERTVYRYTLLAALVLAALWMLVTNPIDVVLFHLIIMPSGLLLLLGTANENPVDMHVQTVLPRQAAFTRPSSVPSYDQV